MKLSEYTDQRTSLAAWASNQHTGRARAAFLNAISALTTPSPVLTVDFGRARFTVDNIGGEFAHAVDETAELEDVKELIPKTGVKFPVGVHIDTGVPSGSAPTNKMVNGIRIPAGVCLIVAGADTGKTPMAHALAGADGANYSVVRYGEPLAGYLADEKLGAKALAECVFGSSDVVLDSVKDVLALAAGGAMKSGISRGALPLLSRWGAIAASVGCTLYIPLNPSSSDDDVVELLVEAAKSNATMTIFAAGNGSWHYVSRRGEGLQRERGSFDTSFTGDGLMSITNVVNDDSSGKTPDGSPVQTLGRLVEVSDTAMHSAMRRAIISSN